LAVDGFPMVHGNDIRRLLSHAKAFSGRPRIR
jgi:hypothetical protein